MTSVLGRSVKLVGETIVGPNLWGLWSADLRPNLISPLFAPATNLILFHLGEGFLLLSKIRRNLIISVPEEGEIFESTPQRKTNFWTYYFAVFAKYTNKYIDTLHDFMGICQNIPSLRRCPTVNEK